MDALLDGDRRQRRAPGRRERAPTIDVEPLPPIDERPAGARADLRQSGRQCAEISRARASRGRIEVAGATTTTAGRLSRSATTAAASTPQDHERIFELFRRAGAQDRPGEGIGLAHVRALVRRLGGTMTLKSELGKGSDVHRHAAARDGSVEKKGVPHERQQQPVTIIMIEDDEGHARLIEKNIRRAGVNNEIMPFANGTAALDYLFGAGRHRQVSKGNAAAGPARPQPAGHDRRRHPARRSRPTSTSSARRWWC